MDGKTLVTRIALLLTGLVFLDMVLWVIFFGRFEVIRHGFGIGLTAVLGYFLIAGHNWARIWMAVRCGIGMLTSFAAFLKLGTLDVSFFSIIRLWLLTGSLVLGAAAIYLLLSKRVSDHFNASTGW